jgi:hypothetical protein
MSNTADHTHTSDMTTIWPTSLPTWRALAAEAGVAADQIGEGATKLDKISPMTSWSFARVLFPLSIGLERTCKLALQVDAKLETGSFLDMKAMREHGHKLDGLIESVEDMSTRRGLDVTRPVTPVHEAIIEVLTGFATNGRYHHLDRLAGASESEDAGKLWWENVLLPLAELHYPAKKREFHEWVADDLGSKIDEFSMTVGAHVSGEEITSQRQTLLDGQMLMVVLPWSRVYVLQIARWLSQILGELSDASYIARDIEIPVLSEFFGLFNVDDSYMRSRKTWRPVG